MLSSDYRKAIVSIFILAGALIFGVGSASAAVVAQATTTPEPTSTWLPLVPSRTPAPTLSGLCPEETPINYLTTTPSYGWQAECGHCYDEWRPTPTFDWGSTSTPVVPTATPTVTPTPVENDWVLWCHDTNLGGGCTTNLSGSVITYTGGVADSPGNAAYNAVCNISTGVCPEIITVYHDFTCQSNGSFGTEIDWYALVLKEHRNGGQDFTTSLVNHGTTADWFVQLSGSQTFAPAPEGIQRDGIIFAGLAYVVNAEFSTSCQFVYSLEPPQEPPQEPPEPDQVCRVVQPGMPVEDIIQLPVIRISPGYIGDCVGWDHVGVDLSQFGLDFEINIPGFFLCPIGVTIDDFVLLRSRINVMTTLMIVIAAGLYFSITKV